MNPVTTSPEIVLNAVTDGVLHVHMHAGSRPWTWWTSASTLKTGASCWTASGLAVEDRGKSVANTSVQAITTTWSVLGDHPRSFASWSPYRACWCSARLKRVSRTGVLASVGYLLHALFGLDSVCVTSRTSVCSERGDSAAELGTFTFKRPFQQKFEATFFQTKPSARMFTHIGKVIRILCYRAKSTLLTCS